MQERSRRTRESLVRATTELVAEVGYHRATTKAIAERAGVSEGTIYRHYPDKRALFAAAVLAGQREVTEWMESLPGRAGTAPLADLLAETFTQLSALREAVLSLDATVGEEDRRHPVVGREDLPAALAAAGGPPHLLAELLAAEQRLGRLDASLEPARTAVMLLAAFLGVQTSPLAGADGLDREDVQAFTALVCCGLAPPPAS